MGERNRPAGFSLLELVIVISLLGMILVALSGGLRFGLQAWRSQEAHSAQYAEVNAVQSTLRAMIASGHDFTGSATSFSFVGVLPESLDRPGLFDIRVEANSKGKLLVSWKSHRRQAAGEAARWGDPTELIGNVDAIDLAYFAVGQEKTAKWQASASSAAAPQLVRVRLRFLPRDPRRWPELIVAPWVGASNANAR